MYNFPIQKTLKYIVFVFVNVAWPANCYMSFKHCHLPLALLLYLRKHSISKK